eukprot:scaffold118784_cov43-Prasinocladus_malaysianus.AAC.1
MAVMKPDNRTGCEGSMIFSLDQLSGDSWDGQEPPNKTTAQECLSTLVLIQGSYDLPALQDLDVWPEALSRQLADPSNPSVTREMLRWAVNASSQALMAVLLKDVLVDCEHVSVMVQTQPSQLDLSIVDDVPSVMASLLYIKLLAALMGSLPSGTDISVQFTHIIQSWDVPEYISNFDSSKPTGATLWGQAVFFDLERGQGPNGRRLQGTSELNPSFIPNEKAGCEGGWLPSNQKKKPSINSEMGLSMSNQSSLPSSSNSADVSIFGGFSEVVALHPELQSAPKTDMLPQASQTEPVAVNSKYIMIAVVLAGGMAVAVSATVGVYHFMR